MLNSAGALPTSSALACSSRALSDGRGQIRAGRLELRLRLQQVGALRDAGVVLVLRDLPRALVRGHRIGQQRDLVVGFTQCKIVGGKRRLSRQCRSGEIRRTRLCTRLRPGHRQAQLAPDVRLPARRKAKPQVAAACHRAFAAVAGRARVETDSREQRGPLLADERLRLRVRGDCGRYILIRHLDLARERRQHGVVEQLPPRPAIERIGGCGREPRRVACRRRFLERRRYRGIRSLIRRADRAGR
jgi:hypothetical protein